MKNTITLTIPFSFKGEEFAPSSKIDLDTFCQQDSSLDVLYHMVATENKIDNFSYQYEVLQASELQFSDAIGIAKNHLSNGTFNMEGFKKDLNEVQVLNIVQEIASEAMGIENLSEHKELKLALQQAYKAGKDS